MKNTLRQVIVALSVLVTIIINILANALPLNGLNTGAISDNFNVYFVPAGYVFSIWGLIYIGLIAYAVYQALPSQRENPRLQATGWWIALGGLANSAWIFLWHYEQFPLTLLAMFTLLATLIITYLRLGIGRTRVTRAETYAVRVPFSVYLGWITVATVANVSDVLDFVKWNRFGLAPEVWMGIMLAVVLVLAVLMIVTRRDLAYILVILWALAGISVKFSAVPVVATPTWITFGLVAAAMLAMLIVKRTPTTTEPAS
ncbi:MAG: tryptophan-rich sensory protein [Anaerolineae bacterium]